MRVSCMGRRFYLYFMYAMVFTGVGRNENETHLEVGLGVMKVRMS